MKIALMGKMHSGKTSTLEFLTKISTEHKRDYKCLKFANPLYETQNLFSKEKHRIFLQELSDLVKKHFGSNILNIKFIEKLTTFLKGQFDIYCDDVRTSSEFEVVKQQGFITIGISASEEIRKTRNPKLFNGINHATEIEIDNLLPLCDYLIQNEESIEQLQHELARIYQKENTKKG
jgi:dephospho-CoA kinase